MYMRQVPLWLPRITPTAGGFFRRRRWALVRLSPVLSLRRSGVVAHSSRSMVREGRSLGRLLMSAHGSMRSHLSRIVRIEFLARVHLPLILILISILMSPMRIPLGRVDSCTNHTTHIRYPRGYGRHGIRSTMPVQAIGGLPVRREMQYVHSTIPVHGQNSSPLFPMPVSARQEQTQARYNSKPVADGRVDLWGMSMLLVLVSVA